MTISAEQGDRGRWRWIVRDGAGHARAVAPVHGFDTQADALRDAREVFGGAMAMPDPHPDADGAEIYAGPRDFE